MKKASLLLFAGLMAVGASAQLSLSGTSYTQNFNSLGSGLPAGWAVHTRARVDTVGLDVSGTKFTSLPTIRWSSTVGGFRNSASANALTVAATPDSAAQATATDRALSVRQVSGATSGTLSSSDSGAAFVLKIANTTGLTGFNMTFKLQSLDSGSARVTTWKVDYATGSNPTAFTPATTTGTMTTGGKTFSNNAVTVSFGAGLDNKTGPVWIRIVALNASTGSGSRATTGIDDISLTWTGTGAGGGTGGTGGGTAVANATKNAVAVTVLGEPTTNGLTAAFTAPATGAYTVGVFDIAGREVARQRVSAVAGAITTLGIQASLQAGIYTVRVANGDSFGVVKTAVR